MGSGGGGRKAGGIEDEFGDRKVEVRNLKGVSLESDYRGCKFGAE